MGFYNYMQTLGNSLVDYGFLTSHVSSNICAHFFKAKCCYLLGIIRFKLTSC